MKTKAGVTLKKILGFGMALVLLGCLGFVGLQASKGSSTAKKSKSEKPYVYLIPEGTKGWCHIVWDDPNASPVIETEDERIVYFNEKGIAHTSSSPDRIYEVQNYYVDNNGKRTEILRPPVEESEENYPESTIFMYGGGPRGIDEGPDGPFYPQVEQFFLGTLDEIEKELKRIEKEEGEDFPPYPEDALKLKRPKK